MTGDNGNRQADGKAAKKGGDDGGETTTGDNGNRQANGKAAKSGDDEGG